MLHTRRMHGARTIRCLLSGHELRHPLFPGARAVDASGVTYTLGFTGIKRIGAAQFHLMTNKDKDGHAFDGANTNHLPMSANAPLKQYWSVTVYARETHALIRDMDRASLASIAQKNADGSVDVYFGPKSCAGREADWAPRDRRGKVALFVRFNGPDMPLLSAERLTAG
jgi:hypothetical protein